MSNPLLSLKIMLKCTHNRQTESSKKQDVPFTVNHPAGLGPSDKGVRGGERLDEIIPSHVSVQTSVCQ